MKKSILLLVALVVVGTIQAQKKIKGNGNIKSITRTTSDYDAVKFTGSFDYVLVAGKEGNIQLEGEENLLEYIITEVKNGQLIVRTQDRINLQTSNNKTIKITVPFESIDVVSLSGSGDVWNEQIIVANEFKVSLSGSGDVKLDVESSNLDATVNGSGDLELKGKTENLKVNVTGSGDYKGFELDANDVEVSVNGSGDARIKCNGHLKARVAGSGDIKYRGNPKKEDFKVAGSGSISTSL